MSSLRLTVFSTPVLSAVLVIAPPFPASCLPTARAEILTFTASLSGLNEAPPTPSSGSGFSTLTIDTLANTMRVEANFENLLAGVTACHIHGATAVPFMGNAGVMTPTPTFPGFPSGVTMGTYDMTFDMTMASSYNPAFVTANGGSVAASFAALISAVEGGRAYLNIHSTQFPGGEIRGFYVPGPGAAAVLALGGLVAARRRRS
ncbi:MAG: CHRD domain-containing protein [Phycisphaerales bacterium]